jgi:hypothetical protein
MIKSIPIRRVVITEAIIDSFAGVIDFEDTSFINLKVNQLVIKSFYVQNYLQ